MKINNFRNKTKCCCLLCKKEFFTGFLQSHQNGKQCIKIYQYEIKCCCLFCKKELSLCLLQKHQNGKQCNLYTNSFFKELGIDHVICPICKEKKKELNNDHLKKHNLTKYQYDKLYPNNPRTCEWTKKKKATLNNMTEENSKNLKFGHTLEGYIKKHGQEEGTKKFLASKKNKSYAKLLEGYIHRYGEGIGRQKYEEDNKKKAITLEKFILRFGEIEGLKKWKKWCNKNSLEHYIELYGEIEGAKKWIAKSEKISKSNSRIDANKIDAYISYRKKVLRFTRLSLAKYELIDIELRGRELKYSLDHKVSICYGFKNNIPEYIIGAIYNLQIISIEENSSKQERCSMGIEELLHKVGEDTFYDFIQQLTVKKFHHKAHIKIK